MADKAPKTPAAAPAAPEAAAPVAASPVTGIEQYEGITVVDNTDAKPVVEVNVTSEEYELADGLMQVNYQ